MKFYRENFKKLRMSLRWTSTTLADAANISRQSISKWESGKREPSEKAIRQLAKILGVNVSEISDLPDSYPVSEKDISEEMNASLLNILSRKTGADFPHINEVISKMIFIKKEASDLSLTLKTILLHTNNIIYIKDSGLKYVIANKTFYDILSLRPEFIIKGKTDSDFFTKQEAHVNSEEDEQVLSSGNPITDIERYIPGTRKQRW